MPTWFMHFGYLGVLILVAVFGMMIPDLDHTYLFGNSCHMNDAFKQKPSCTPERGRLLLHRFIIPLAFIVFGLSYLMHLILDSFV